MWVELPLAVLQGSPRRLVDEGQHSQQDANSDTVAGSMPHFPTAPIPSCTHSLAATAQGSSPSDGEVSRRPESWWPGA
jgi:hypothetical protein